MKKIAYILCLWAFFTLSETNAQGISFHHGTWEEAIEKAKKEYKLIFVDAYTTWCGPCKRMSREIFPKEEVGQFYNKNFINVKLDMEKGEGLAFRKRYKVNAFPTFLFINGAGDVVSLERGARPTEQFIQIGKKALSLFSDTESLDARYEEGARDADFLYQYAYALLRAGKPTLKIANEYLRTQDDWSTDKNLDAVFDFATQMDSRIFTGLLEHQTAIIKRKGKAAYKQQVELAAETTLKSAIEYKDVELFEEMVDKMKRALPAHAEAFEYKKGQAFYLMIGDAKQVLKYAKKYLKKIAPEQPKALHWQAEFLARHLGQPKALKMAENAALDLIKLEENYTNYALLADIYHKQARKEDALKMAQKAETYEKPPGLNATSILIQKLKGE